MASFFGWMIESSLLVLMLLGIRRAFMGRVRYAGIYALWLVILVRFMIPVNLVSTPFSVGSVILQAVSSWNQGEELERTASAEGLLEQNKEQASRENNVQTDSADELSGGQENPITNMGRAILTNQNTVVSQDERSHQLISDETWQKIFYARTVISGVIFLWLLLSNLCLLRKLKKGRVLYGCRGHVKIYGVSHIKNPCLYGFFRPVIYIPRALLWGEDEERAEAEELEQIVTHEYVHYLHKDYIWAMFRVLLVSVYWYHPFLWLAVSCSKKDAELFCDETVIEMLGEERRFSYGEMLVRIAGDARWGDFRYSLMPMSRRGKEMEKRIRAISDRKQYSKWLLLPLVFVVSAAIGITCSTGIGPAAENKTGNQEQIGEEQEKGRKNIGEGNAEGPGADSTAGMEEFSSRDSDYKKTGAAEGDSSHASGTLLTSGEEAVSRQNGGEAQQEEIKLVYSATYEVAFQHYIEEFTEAVNTGNTDKMHQVLAVDTEVYEQQCAMAKNYHKRGIREKVKKYTIFSVKMDTSARVEIASREKIKVYYGDATSKLVRQQYRYTCENIDGNWVITKMDEIS